MTYLCLFYLHFIINLPNNHFKVSSGPFLSDSVLGSPVTRPVQSELEVVGYAQSAVALCQNLGLQAEVRLNVPRCVVVKGEEYMTQPILHSSV